MYRLFVDAALALAIVAFVVLLRNRTETSSLLMGTPNIVVGRTPHEQAVALVTLGLVLVTIVAVVKILTQNNNRRDQ